jgi:glucokinase
MVPEVIGIDLGGTAIKLGRFTREGKCIKAFSTPTPQPADPAAVLNHLVEAIAQLTTKDSQIVAVGVGTPGPADTARRIARLAINLPGWVDIPIAGWIEKATGLPTTIANDADCAALGEAWLGLGREYSNFLLLTLGTGVGGAIIRDGGIYSGSTGAGGELGLMCIDPDGPLCNSGNRGSLEQFVSATAIERETGKSAKELGDLAAVGNEEALAFWQRYGQYLGIGIVNLMYVLAPEAILIGGGVSASAQFFLPAVATEIEKRMHPTYAGNIKVLPAKLGNDAGTIGAAKLAWTNVPHS